MTESYGKISPAEHRQRIPTAFANEVAEDIATLAGLTRTLSRGEPVYANGNETILAVPSRERSETIVKVMPPAGKNFETSQLHLLAAIRAYRDYLLAKAQGGNTTSSFIALDRWGFQDLEPRTYIVSTNEAGELQGTCVGPKDYDPVVYAADQASVLRFVAQQVEDGPERAAAIIGLPADQFDRGLQVLEVAQLQPTALAAAQVVLHSLTTLASNSQ